MAMKHIEEELKRALAEVEPPEGLAGRVLARVAERERGRRARAGWLGLAAAPGWRWAFAAVLCVALVAGGIFYQRARTRAEGERAKEQLMLALEITASKLEIAQATVQGINSGAEAEQ